MNDISIQIILHIAIIVFCSPLTGVGEDSALFEYNAEIIMNIQRGRLESDCKYFYLFWLLLDSFSPLFLTLNYSFIYLTFKIRPPVCINYYIPFPPFLLFACYFSLFFFSDLSILLPIFFCFSSSHPLTLSIFPISIPRFPLVLTISTSSPLHVHFLYSPFKI